LCLSIAVLLAAAPYELVLDGSAPGISGTHAFAQGNSEGAGGGNGAGNGAGGAGENGGGSAGANGGNAGADAGEAGSGNDAGNTGAGTDGEAEDDPGDAGEERGQGVGSQTAPADRTAPASALEVHHRDGISERLGNGRYEMQDAQGRTIVSRPAMPEDHERLRALSNN